MTDAAEWPHSNGFFARDLDADDLELIEQIREHGRIACVPIHAFVSDEPKELDARRRGQSLLIYQPRSRFYVPEWKYELEVKAEEAAAARRQAEWLVFRPIGLSNCMAKRCWTSSCELDQSIADAKAERERRVQQEQQQRSEQQRQISLQQYWRYRQVYGR